MTTNKTKLVILNDDVLPMQKLDAIIQLVVPSTGAHYFLAQLLFLASSRLEISAIQCSCEVPNERIDE